MATVRVARDPNEKFGPSGDVVPGQLMSYTVTYENEGQGIAFGVYIEDQFSPHLDESTLEIFGPGQYFSQTRTLLWDIGELAPKGQVGSTGAVSFTVRLKPGLASGTVITNGAVVYFPSVPERTPTNVVVNTVQPLTAEPATLSTPALTPVPVTLRGRDASNSALTFTVVDQPLNGTLSGTAPNLTYTPASNFTGGDTFTFKVSNGITESRPAAVEVVVEPSSSDTAAPEVLWTDPLDGASGVSISGSPWLTDGGVSYYFPTLVIQFSEAMSTTTVTSTTVQLRDSQGGVVPIRVTYDGSGNRAIIWPQVVLQARSSYTIRVSRDASDASGNRMAAVFASTFRTGEVSAGNRIFLPVILTAFVPGW